MEYDDTNGGTAKRDLLARFSAAEMSYVRSGSLHGQDGSLQEKCVKLGEKSARKKTFLKIHSIH